jgi:prolyl oligopeptidase
LHPQQQLQQQLQERLKRWLENVHSEETAKWLSEQDKMLTHYRNNLVLEDRLFNKLLLYSYVDYKPLVKKGKYYFSMQYDYEGNVPSLYYRKKINGNAFQIVDPNNFKENKNEVLAIRSYEVSYDNNYLAFSLSQNGADWCSIRIKDIEKNKALPDKIENVKFASICWKGNGFFYLRYDSVGTQDRNTIANSNPKIYYHRLDSKQIEDIFIYEVSQNINFKYFNFNVTSDEKYLIISSYLNIESKPYKGMLYAKLDSFPKIELKPFLLLQRSNTYTFNFVDNIGDNFVVLTDLSASTKRLLIYDPSQGVNHWKILVKPYANILTNVSITKDKIICLYYLNGQYAASVFDINGNILTSIPFPVGCKVTGFNANKDDEESICFINSFYFPSAVYKLDFKTMSLDPIGETNIAYDHMEYETSYVKYMSTDSVEIPMYLTYKKGIKRSKNNPTILYGYGGLV